MRPLAIIFGAPSCDLMPGIEQIPEPTYVETFVPESAMKAFHVPVLRGFAWLNMNGIDPLLVPWN
jgi:hypothetical protein